VQVLPVIIFDPVLQVFDKFIVARPFREPEAFFLHSAHEPLGIGVTLGVAVARKGLAYAQRAASLHEGDGRWLTPVVGHQVQALVPCPVRELVVDRHVEGRKPVGGLASKARLIAYDLLGVPVQCYDYVDPAEPLDQDLRHVYAPPLVGPYRTGLGRLGAFGLQLSVRPDCKAVYLHQALDALLVERKLVDITQVRPSPAVTPEWVGGFYITDALDKPLVARGDLF